MEIIGHNNLHSYLEVVEDFLLEKEVVNNMPIGVLYSLMDTEDDIMKDLFLSRVVDNNKNILLAIMTPPQNLIIVGEDNDKTTEKLRF
ncbi:hypothetical protein I0Q91_04670 [Halanaerobiaceae bacterium Z-7014]|uniref:Uncharacterized protein n=1 Tax=Halonatronomonas betaini TaxID=2778430 RepID=A0A931AT76_9FIRM|nr:hypothetical protein [Halonatronomonas betaini]MBF8436365.1 hypothetical protein [Halonatronomonas betaini]